MHPPFSFPLVEKRMRRVRWKRKDAFVQTCSKRKFGKCGSQLFCPKTCQSLRSTGGVRSLSSLVRRADSHMKPRDANRTPSASLSAAAPPSNSGRGFQRGGPQPAPLCRFKGVRGEIEIPPRFSLGGRGGHSLFKREYPLGFSVPNRYSSAGNSGPMWEHHITLALRTAPRYCCPLSLRQ